MSATVDWPCVFLAVSSLVGEPLDVSFAALDGAATDAARALAQQLGARARSDRVRALASALSGVAAEMGLGFR